MMTILQPIGRKGPNWGILVLPQKNLNIAGSDLKNSTDHHHLERCYGCSGYRNANRF